MKLIVGLGNPGRRYRRTRHNLGFEVIDELGRRWRIEPRKEKFSGLVEKGRILGQAVCLLKPLTYMNCSGDSVAQAVRFFKVDPADLLLIIDDLDLPPGKIRLRARGSPGGHKGLSDCLEKLGTQEVCRLRLGIGSPPQGDAVDYVLSRPGPVERMELDRGVAAAADAAELWLTHGPQRAMNEVNKGTNT